MRRAFHAVYEPNTNREAGSSPELPLPPATPSCLSGYDTGVPPRRPEPPPPVPALLSSSSPPSGQTSHSTVGPKHKALTLGLEVLPAPTQLLPRASQPRTQCRTHPVGRRRPSREQSTALLCRGASSPKALLLCLDLCRGLLLMLATKPRIKEPQQQGSSPALRVAPAGTWCSAPCVHHITQQGTAHHQEPRNNRNVQARYKLLRK